MFPLNMLLTNQLSIVLIHHWHS